MKPSFKRRQYPIVSRSRQYRMLLLIMIYTCSICAVLFVGLFVPDILVMQDDAASITLRAAAADRLLSLHARLWPTVLAIVCLIGLHSFRVFTRFIGPLYRFRWAFAGVAAGELTRRVHLRTGDELMQEADQFNAMMDQVSGIIGRAQTAAEAALSAARQITAAAEASDGAAAVALLTADLTRTVTDLDEQFRHLIVAAPAAAGDAGAH
ncbi:MAG: methyl-accepting chemotaxis protein [Pseudomonadota bacterium]